MTASTVPVRISDGSPPATPPPTGQTSPAYTEIPIPTGGHENTLSVTQAPSAPTSSASIPTMAHPDPDPVQTPGDAAQHAPSRESSLSINQAPSRPTSSTTIPTLATQSSSTTTTTSSPPAVFPHPPSDPVILAHINKQVTTRVAASPIYAFLFPRLAITHASRGHVVARLPLAAQHVNAGGGLHGGVSATIVDWAGGMAIAAWDCRVGTGVSVDINVSYLSSARVGDTIEIEGRAERVGGSLGYTTVGIYRVDGEGGRGDVVALGRHTKFVRQKK